MSLKDRRGLSVSTGNRQSLDALETAAELLHGYYGNPLEVIDKALADDPDFVMGHCFRAAMIATTSEKSLEPELKRSVAEARQRERFANDRERRYIAATAAWAEGEFGRALEIYGDLLTDYPLDLVALQAAHLSDFFLGQSSMLRDRVAQVLPNWHAGVPGYGFVKGMYAFGLEEMGAYEKAERVGREALSIDRRDPWAVHAIAHVMEMQGRTSDGIGFMTETADDWSKDNSFAFHNWWHLALYHLDRGDTEAVLSLYDRAIRPQPNAVILEMIDATAMMWRLHLRGVEVGNRWEELADLWSKTVRDGFYAFNDAHAMMALVATGRTAEAKTLLETMAAAARQGGTNARMSAEVGLPVAEAIQAFGEQRYDVTVQRLQQIRPYSARFGGSHAQRDVIGLTLIEAALRGGKARLAKALAAERLALKPSSPHNLRLAKRADAAAAAATTELVA